MKLLIALTLAIAACGSEIPDEVKLAVATPTPEPVLEPEPVKPMTKTQVSIEVPAKTVTYRWMVGSTLLGDDTYKEHEKVVESDADCPDNICILETFVDALVTYKFKHNMYKCYFRIYLDHTFDNGEPVAVTPDWEFLRTSKYFEYKILGGNTYRGLGIEADTKLCDQAYQEEFQPAQLR